MARSRSKSTPKKSTRKKAARRKASSSRKRLTPRKEKRGLVGAEVLLEPGTPELRPLAEQVSELGGTGGSFWTPNGRHRLAAAKVLGLRQITALISPDEDLAFRILALNTEKAHNLRDRSLEVIRMARALEKRHKRGREIDYAAEFESPALLTLGIVYEQEKRFAGGAYHPFLRKVDHFSSRTLSSSLRQREGWASRLIAIERQVAASARKFDAASVRERDLALVAAVAGDDEG